MSATLKFRQIGEVTVVDIEGVIDLGDGSTSLREAVKTLVADGKKKIVLNLGGTTYVDSSGIGELVAGFTVLSRLGGQLKLMALTKGVKDLLQITKLYSVFEVFEDEAKAIASFD